MATVKIPAGKGCIEMNTPNQLKKVGKLILKNRPAIRTIHEIADLFNIPHAKVHEGVGFMYRGAVDLSPKVSVWWPKIEPLRPRSGWVNVPKYDSDQELVEINERYSKSPKKNAEHIHNLKTLYPQRRIVFARFMGGKAYEYVGEFQFDAKRSANSAVWVMVSADCDLKDVAKE